MKEINKRGVYMRMKRNCLLNAMPIDQWLVTDNNQIHII